MADQDAFKNSPSRGAASLHCLPDLDPSLHRPRVQLTDDVPVYSDATGLRYHDRGDGPRTETAPIQKLDSSDILLGDEDEDSDDDPATLSLCGMSPPGSILSDEELLLDQIKDFNKPDEAYIQVPVSGATEELLPPQSHSQTLNSGSSCPLDYWLSSHSEDPVVTYFCLGSSLSLSHSSGINCRLKSGQQRHFTSSNTQ